MRAPSSQARNNFPPANVKVSRRLNRGHATSGRDSGISSGNAALSDGYAIARQGQRHTRGDAVREMLPLTRQPGIFAPFCLDCLATLWRFVCPRAGGLAV
ncbi:hypothetical protein MTO96_027478 [Rhipicephalus appendiculatus]